MNRRNPREGWLIRITLLLGGLGLVLFLLPAVVISGARNAGQIAYLRAAFGQASSITGWAAPLWQFTNSWLPPQQRSADQRILARAVWANGDDAGAATILGLGGETSPANMATYFHPDWSSAGRAIPDTLAARHLSHADEALAAGDEEGATLWIDAALVLRPDDIYANYQRWRLADKTSEKAAQALNNLVKFTERAVLPATASVANYAIAVTPDLVADRIWTPEQLERAASLWVWQYPESSALGDLLDTQCAAGKEDSAHWCELVDERTSRLDNGAALATDPQSASTSPDLQTLLAQLDISNATPGKSVYRHGGVETWKSLAAAAEWGWYNMSTPPEFNSALFTGGVDSWQPFAGDNAVRVDGVWQLPDTGDDLARAGYWAVPITHVLPGSAWLLSFAYRTSGDAPSASVWVSDQSDITPPEMYLPGTNGEWRREAILLTNHGATAYDVRPLFRNWGEQTVWFDEIQLQPLTGVDSSKTPNWQATWESTEDAWLDSMPVSYLSRAADAIAANDRQNALLWLDAVLSLRPDDLYANYYRWRFAGANTDAENDPYLQRLLHFSEAGLLPRSQQVAEFAVALAPKLVADGIWTPEQLERAARAWVWKYPDMPALTTLLDSQCTSPSAGDQWCKLAAERAERSRNTESTTQAGPSAPETPQSLQPILAELGISGAVVGPSTFKHGAIETWASPEAAEEWKWSSMVNAPNFNEALFTGGTDSWQPFAGESAMRIDGLWQEPDTGPNPARSGYWAVPTQTLPAGSAFLLSFAYRTSGDEPSASVWLGGQPGVTPPELYLPGTNGEWRQEGVLLVNHGASSFGLRPLFRNWDEQTVWFDEIQFQPLSDIDVANLPDRRSTWEPQN